MSIVAHEKTARDIITMDAYTSGLKTGAVSSAVAAVGVLTANKHWNTFRTRLNVTGKMALVVSAFLGGFTIVAESKLVEGARDPERYLARIHPDYVPEKKLDPMRHLGLHHRLANFVYDHPYRSLASVGVPLVGSIYAIQRTNHAIAASQQIMHTRIYGQGAVVCLLLTFMGFNDYMRKRGRFE
jgi:hypothetical protein